MNPFDDPDGEFFVLVNDEGQHSLWPTFVVVPDGWRIVHDRDTREASLRYVEENWTDMRPASLVAATGGRRPSASVPVSSANPPGPA